MVARVKPHCQEALAWLKLRGWSLAPLTGQDRSTLEAIAHCWTMYFRSDERGREASLCAASILIGGCQSVCWPMARELIAWAGDWGDRDRLWPLAIEPYREDNCFTRLADGHTYLKQVGP